MIIFFFFQYICTEITFGNGYTYGKINKINIGSDWIEL